MSDECQMAVIGWFDLVTRMMNDEDRKNSFYSS